MSDLKYFDIHCHPFIDPLKAEQDAVIEKMKEDGVGGIVVGVDLKTSEESTALAEKYDHLWATVGLHPNDRPTEKFDARFEKLATHPKVVGIGECGIDYYRITGDVDSEKKRQWENFESQITLATALDKPLMIHCRPSKGTMDSYLDLLAYLEPRVKDNPKLRGNLHFFVGDIAVAKRFWALGFSTSFTGVLTFTHDYDEVVEAAPADLIMVETDAPFAAPMPYRGQVNYPSYVTLIIEEVAKIRGEPLDVTTEILATNTRRIFKLF